jgi:hypothetical protein
LGKSKKVKCLIHSLIQIKQLILAKESGKEEILKKMIVQLSVLQDQLELAICENSQKIDATKINKKLSEFEQELSELAAIIKFPIAGGNK